MGMDGQSIKREREEQARAKVVVMQGQDQPPAKPYGVDCAACKLEHGMERKTVPRFGLIVRVIGFIIATPSAFGMAIGLFSIARAFIGKGAFGNDSGVALIAGLFAFGLSAVGGLIGWLLLGRKKAFVCRRCGYLLERA